jgi:hypothetical protein
LILVQVTSHGYEALDSAPGGSGKEHLQQGELDDSTILLPSMNPKNRSRIEKRPTQHFAFAGIFIRETASLFCF